MTLPEELIQSIRFKTPNSNKLFQISKTLSPGGVHSNSRLYPPYPFYLKQAKGSKVVDVDGNEYIDYCLGHGPLILGHSHPAVVEAVQAQLERGTQFVPAHEGEIKLSQKIVEHVPQAQLVRFTSSGSEAVMLAIRLARAYTKREKIVKFEGGFAGNYDSVSVSTWPDLEKAGPIKRPHPVPDSAGLPKNVLDNTVVVPFNDVGALEDVFGRMSHEIAAVVTEPFFRAIPPRRGFLSSLRRLTSDNGTLLVFDEIVTGFRLALGGGQEFYNTTADLVTLGKIIGGGFPAGAVAGKREIMALMDPSIGGANGGLAADDYVYHSATYCGNPISTTAGLATIEQLEKVGVYQKLRMLGEHMRNGIRDAASDCGVDVLVTGEGPMWHIFFTDSTIDNYRDIPRTHANAITRLHLELVNSGVLAQYSKSWYGRFLSLAHTDEDLAKTEQVFCEAFKHMRSSLGSYGSVGRR